MKPLWASVGEESVVGGDVGGCTAQLVPGLLPAALLLVRQRKKKPRGEAVISLNRGRLPQGCGWSVGLEVAAGENNKVGGLGGDETVVDTDVSLISAISTFLFGCGPPLDPT